MDRKGYEKFEETEFIISIEKFIQKLTSYLVHSLKPT